MKYKCKLCNEILAYRALHFETCHAEKIYEYFDKAPGAKVTGGNPDEKGWI